MRLSKDVSARRNTNNFIALASCSFGSHERIRGKNAHPDKQQTTPTTATVKHPTHHTPHTTLGGPSSLNKPRPNYTSHFTLRTLHTLHVTFYDTTPHSMPYTSHVRLAHRTLKFHASICITLCTTSHSAPYHPLRSTSLGCGLYSTRYTLYTLHFALQELHALNFTPYTAAHSTCKLCAAHSTV